MIQKPKGTYDVFGDYGKQIKYLENLLNTLMDTYHYEYVRTPIFESSSLFHRGVGETTDIVSKETYDFKDRGDRNITLRPEGTAGVVRSYIENKMYGDPTQPIKLFYNGTMYRYERPQSGRYCNVSIINTCTNKRFNMLHILPPYCVHCIIYFSKFQQFRRNC